MIREDHWGQGRTLQGTAEERKGWKQSQARQPSFMLGAPAFPGSTASSLSALQQHLVYFHLQHTSISWEEGEAIRQRRFQDKLQPDGGAIL